MYATFSYDVTTGRHPIEDVRTAMLEAFSDRRTCDLLADTFICDVADGLDYLALVRKLRKAAKDLDDQFVFVITLHSTGGKLRSNAPFSAAKARAIIGSGDSE